MLKVLGKSPSINVRKVLWVLEELGLACVQEQYGAGFASTSTGAFRAMNPNGLVPVLVDGDFVLWESNTICRYLAAREGRVDLLPGAPGERATVEQWMDWQATELNDAWRYPFMALVRRSPDHRDEAAIRSGIAEWNRHMRIVDEQLGRTGAFMTGGAFTLADIVIGVSANRWLMTPMERPELPALQAYLERLDRRPGFRMHARNGTP